MQARAARGRAPLHRLLRLRNKTPPGAVAARCAQRREACVRVGGRGRSELCALHTAPPEQRHGALRHACCAGLLALTPSVCSPDGRRGDRWLGRWPDARGLDAFLRRSLRSVSAAAAAALVPSQELPSTRCGLCLAPRATQAIVELTRIFVCVPVAQEALLSAIVSLSCSVVVLVVTGRGKLLFSCSVACLAASAYTVSAAMQFGAHLLVRAPGSL